MPVPQESKGKGRERGRRGKRRHLTNLFKSSREDVFAQNLHIVFEEAMLGRGENFLHRKIAAKTELAETKWYRDLPISCILNS